MVALYKVNFYFKQKHAYICTAISNSKFCLMFIGSISNIIHYNEKKKLVNFAGQAYHPFFSTTRQLLKFHWKDNTSKTGIANRKKGTTNCINLHPPHLRIYTTPQNPHALKLLLSIELWPFQVLAIRLIILYNIPLICSRSTSSGYFALKSLEALLWGMAWSVMLIMTFMRLCWASFSWRIRTDLEK